MAKKHVDPVDPDPEHCKLQEKLSSLKREHYPLQNNVHPDPYSHCGSGASRPKLMRTRIHKNFLFRSKIRRDFFKRGHAPNRYRHRTSLLFYVFPLPSVAGLDPESYSFLAPGPDTESLESNCWANNT